ncbi:MAG TPA: hypothetical protein VFX98_10075 [Longimicrobiaceae bacterium]|nr:hypothetical protein [Longimicrobiaceae bacterium]
MNVTLRPLSRCALLALALAALPACEAVITGCAGNPTAPGCEGVAGQGELTGTLGTSRTLRPETTYVLKGYVKVAAGATLTILPGTRIVGDSLTPGSALFVLRGARLVAEGTADAPIVFTSQRAPGARRPGDWGGIVLIGRGIINRTAQTILTEGPQDASQNYAGGTDNGDDSGRLRYVRVEYAGYDVTGTGQELNSLSMYAVGRGTQLENVQSLAGLDDSFEWWGGAVDGKYLLSVEAGDDHFDWTEGYQGRNQFLIAFQNQQLQPRPGTGSNSSDPRGFEGDGCDPAPGSGCTLAADTGSTPLSNPTFGNFTLVGFRQIPPTEGNGMVLRRGTAGGFYNGVVVRWKGTGLNVRDAFTNRNRIAGRLEVKCMVFGDNGKNYDDETSTSFGKKSFFAADGHREADGAAAGLFASLDPTSPDFTPAAGSLLATGGCNVPNARLTGYLYGWATTTYVGATNPNGVNQWWLGWTSYATS